jgi:hypothetical protein
MEKLSFTGLGQWILEEFDALQKSIAKRARVEEIARQLREAQLRGDPDIESKFGVDAKGRHVVRDSGADQKPVTMMSAQERSARQKTAAEEAKVARQYTGESSMPDDVKGLQFGTTRMITNRKTDTKDPKSLQQEPSFSRHDVMIDGQKIGSADVDHQHQIGKVDTKHKYADKDVMAALSNQNNTPEERARWASDQNIIKEHAAEIKQRSKAGQREPNLTINLDSEHTKDMTPEQIQAYKKHIHTDLYAHIKSKKFKQAVNAHTEEANVAAQAAHAEELKAKGKISNLGQNDNVGAATETVQAKQATQDASTANIAPGTGETTPQKPSLEYVTERKDTSPMAPLTPQAPDAKAKAAAAAEQNAAGKVVRQEKDKELATAQSAGSSIEDGRAKFHATLAALKKLHQDYVEGGKSALDIRHIQDHIDDHMKNWNKYNPQTEAEPTLPKPSVEAAPSKPGMFEMDLGLGDSPKPKAKDTAAPVYFDPSTPEKV